MNLSSRCPVAPRRRPGFPIILGVCSLLAGAGFAAAPAAPATPPNPLPALVDLLRQSADTQLQLDLLRGVSAAFKGRRQVPMPAGWDAVETRLGQSANADVRALTLSLSLTFGSSRALAALRQTVTDRSADLNARRTALAALLDTRDTGLPPILQGLLKDPDLRGAALRALAGYDDPATPGAILELYGALPAPDQRDGLNTLASRAPYAKALVGAVVDGRIPRNALTADLVRQLRNLRNEEINTTLATVYGTVRESSADKRQEIERYKRVYWAGGSQPGDGPRGRAVFAKTCQQCHTLFDTGGKVGPDLTGSNRGDLDYILQNIVDPNAVIPNEYRASTVDMKDGRSLTCIVKQQDDKAVTVVTQNETLVLPRNEIDSIQQSELSMMPEGLLAPLTDQEVRDLIYYLSRPGQVPPPPETAGK